MSVFGHLSVLKEMARHGTLHLADREFVVTTLDRAMMALTRLELMAGQVQQHTNLQQRLATSAADILKELQ